MREVVRYPPCPDPRRSGSRVPECLRHGPEEVCAGGGYAGRTPTDFSISVIGGRFTCRLGSPGTEFMEANLLLLASQSRHRRRELNAPLGVAPWSYTVCGSRHDREVSSAYSPARTWRCPGRFGAVGVSDQHTHACRC